LENHPAIQSLEPVETNIVIAQLKGGRPASDLVEAQQKEGILCSAFGPDKVRWVTHLDFGDAELDKVLKALSAWN
jgi:threonine aldolase